jgi:hypothetical protein
LEAIAALKDAGSDDLAQLHIRGVKYQEEGTQDAVPPYAPPPHSDMFAWNAHLLQPMMVCMPAVEHILLFSLYVFIMGV